jgi:uncharacterized protein with ParB-like and HNH nuclease domain
MTLIEEVNNARLKVHTDAYPMSIGEMVNLYQDGEIEIHPEFQRVYRWTPEQKSKLIESIILGIPLPSIFVAQREDGVWDVVDGLQRLSTIFSFLGVLKKEDGEIETPLKLSATKYLKSLEGKVWEDQHSPERQIDIEIKRMFKREKIDLKIIKRESEGDTKFELFQRLNTGGSKLSDQEVRNCMLLMLNKERYPWLQDLSSNENFTTTLPISSKQKEECYSQELVLRFIVQRHFDEDTRKSHNDVGPYLDAELNRIFNTDNTVLNYENEKEIFENTFELMNQALEDNAFKKFNHDKNKRSGPVSIAVFEAISLGLSRLVEENKIDKGTINDKIKSATQNLTQHKDYLDSVDKSMRPLDRMVLMGKLGMELFSEG